MIKSDRSNVSFTKIFFSLIWLARYLMGSCLGIVVIGGCVFSIEGFSSGNHKFLLGLYMSFITALTIGYGDMTPDGPVGKVFAVILGMAGILLTGVIVAASIKALERST
ncbi:MAG: potassium channel family protein [Candidatus Hodarchaeota archaeon]